MATDSARLLAREVAARLCAMNKLQIVVFLGLLAGCGGGENGGDTGVDNNGGGDSCTNDFECDLGTFCIDGSCKPEGDECAEPEDCGLGQTCRAGHCVEYVPDCVEHEECEDGQVCVSDACVPGCRDNDECGDDEVCDPESHSCVNAAPNNGLPCGGECPDHQECDLGSQECVPDGTCDEDEHCEGEAVCVGGFCRPPERPCARNNDCAEGSYCNRDTMRCAPGCRQANECRVEEVCVMGQCSEPPECAADPNEPNDLADEATEVFDGDRYEGLTICEEDDWFSFIAFAGDEVTFTVSFIHDFGNINLQLFQPNGDLLQQIAGNTDSERLDREIEETGVYTVRVHGGGRGVFNSYDLDVDITRNCRDDSFEPNDHPEEATEIEPGEYPERLMCGDDDDWHRMQLYAGETLTASISFSAALGDLDLGLYDANRDLIELAETEDDGESIEFTADVPQIVYVHVPGDEALINGYDLSLVVESPDCTADDREDDDTFEQATEVSAGDTIEGTVCASDADWFTLVLPPDVPLELTLSLDNAVGDLDLQIIGADGETVVAQSATQSDEESIDFLVDNAGRYYIRVGGVGRAQGSYTLTVGGGFTATCPEDDRFEENDRLSMSRLLNPPGRHGNVIMCEGDDDDWYRFQLQEGQSAEVYVLYLEDEGRLEVDLLDPDAIRDDDLPFQSAVGISPTKRVRAPLGSAPGTWKVRVRRFDGAEVRYAIRLFIYDGPLPLSCEFDDEFEPDDEAVDATRIQAGVPYDAIVCGDNSDWYRIDAEAGEIINVRIDHEHLAGNVDAVLHRGQPLRPVIRANSMTDNEFIRFQATSDGPLFVEVTYSGDEGNLYTVLLSKLEGPESQSCEFDDRFEQNDDYAEAPLTEPGIYTAVLCGDDDDFYGVDLEEGQLLRATLVWEGDRSFDFGLVGPGNIEVANAGDHERPVREITYAAPSAGRFALAVTSEQDNDTLYTVRFEVLDVEPEPCGDADAAEPNDSVLDATDVVEDVLWEELQLCGADEDWFRVVVPRRAGLLVDAAFDHDIANLEIEAFAENGGAYAASYGPGSTERVILEAGNEETVFLVRIFTRDADEVPLDYDLGFFYAGVSGCALDENEPNDARSSATTVTAGEYESLTLCPEDVDWFVIQTQPFETVTVTISFDHDEHNLGLAMFDPGFQIEVGRSDGMSNTETVSWPSLFGGPIQIQVFGSGGNGTGYAMTVDLE